MTTIPTPAPAPPVAPGTLHIPRSEDGCYHPSTEAEIAALVRHARETRSQLRVIGSSHSVWRSIVTDAFAGRATPPGDMPVVLDRYTHVSEPVPDPDHEGMMLVEVQAGCHLGSSPLRPVQGRIATGGSRATDVKSPSPWHDGTWETSLNYLLHHRFQLALPELGGISHQTVGGFLATGSSGGGTKWSVQGSIARLRVVDGDGNVTELREDGPDPDWFRAAGVSMGLCGVVSTVTFRCEPAYDIVGSETISATSRSDDIDFYADRPASGLPSLEQFLTTTDYSRLMWWPQRGFDRLVVWQAKRAAFDPDLEIKPYREIAMFPVLSQIGASLVYTVLGNIEQPERVLEQLRPVRSHPDAAEAARALGDGLRGAFTPPMDPDFPLEPQQLLPWLTALLQRLRGERHDPITLSAAWIPLVELLVTGTDAMVASALNLPIMRPIFRLLGRWLPEHIDTILGLFVSAGPGGAPATQQFQDRWFIGLPMDNQMDDLLMPTWFTELWIPFAPGDGTVDKVIATLRKLFHGDGTAAGAYAATGAFAFELYAAKADPTFFLSAANGTRDVFRVDVFWFGRNAGDPVTDFYPQFWEALRPFGYRLHWGKFLPRPDPSDPTRLTRPFPDFDRWRKVRARVDPGNVFLTRYWREHLGL
jgi:hypothetical protein